MDVDKTGDVGKGTLFFLCGSCLVPTAFRGGELPEEILTLKALFYKESLPI